MKKTKSPSATEKSYTVLQIFRTLKNLGQFYFRTLFSSEIKISLIVFASNVVGKLIAVSPYPLRSSTVVNLASAFFTAGAVIVPSSGSYCRKKTTNKQTKQQWVLNTTCITCVPSQKNSYSVCQICKNKITILLSGFSTF